MSPRRVSILFKSSQNRAGGLQGKKRQRATEQQLSLPSKETLTEFLQLLFANAYFLALEL